MAFELLKSVGLNVLTLFPSRTKELESSIIKETSNEALCFFFQINTKLLLFICFLEQEFATSFLAYYLTGLVINHIFLVRKVHFPLTTWNGNYLPQLLDEMWSRKTQNYV